MGNPCSFGAIISRSGRHSLSKHKLPHRLAGCLISDKDRTASRLHFWFHDQRRMRCGFSRDCEGEAGAIAPSNASFSRPSPTTFSGSWRTKPRSRPSSRAKRTVVPVARPKQSHLNRRPCARSRCARGFGDGSSRCATLSRTTAGFRSRLPSMITTSNSARPARPESSIHFPCRRKSGVWYNVWMDEPLLVHPPHWKKSWRA